MPTNSPIHLLKVNISKMTFVLYTL